MGYAQLCPGPVHTRGGQRSVRPGDTAACSRYPPTMHTPVPSARPYGYQLIAVTLGFALAGPLGGCLLVLLLGLATMLPDAGVQALRTVLLAAPLVVLVGMLLGLLPAALSGLLYALLRHRVRPGWPDALLAAGCGAGVLVACCLAIAIDQGSLGRELAGGRWQSWLVTAAFGGACALIARGLCRCVQVIWVARRGK